MSKLIAGVGTNDANYAIKPVINGKQVPCPFYRVWHHMLERCYQKPHVMRNPTYRDCSVCPGWLLFSNFKEWMEKQDWQGKQLDKDLVRATKVYSSETCCFVPGWLNSLFTDHGRARGKWPMGVCFHKQRQKFQAQLRINGKTKHLGLFDTPRAAHDIYLKAKREYVINKMKDYPDQRIKQAVLARV